MSAAALLAAAWLAAAPSAPPNPRPVDWTEGEVVVSATPGPVFWRVSRGDSEVWILGVPDIFLQRQRWDDRRLRRLLTGASELLMRAEYHATGAVRRRSATSGLEARLPPELRPRVDAAVRAAGLSPARYLDLTSLETAFHLQHDLTASVGLGNDEPELHVRALAARLHTPTRPVARYEVPWAEIEGAESTLAPCVEGALADAAFDREHTAAASRAWAVGDLRTVRAQSAESTLDACMKRAPPYGTLAARTEADTADAVLAALGRGGRAVAVQTLDDLLRPDGVLARLRAAGAEVTAPEAARP